MQITPGVRPISAIDFVDPMPFKKFRPKFSVYQVCVTILEAKHLPQNANPVVIVKVGNRKRRTMMRERTDNPVYNEVKLSSLSKLCFRPALNYNGRNMQIIPSRVISAVHWMHERSAN